MRIAFFFATLLATSLAAAAIPIDGWYASVFGGYSYIPDNIGKTHGDFRFTHVSYDNGYNAGSRIGFQSYPLRYEGEFTYIKASVSSFLLRHFFLNPFKQRKISGETTAALGMGTIYYDFPEMVPCIAPYIGAGLGYGWVDARLNSRGPLYRTRFRGSDSAFAYQGTAGITYNFAENYALNLAYRYVGTTRIDELGKVFQANLASVGVVYRFNEYNYK